MICLEMLGSRAYISSMIVSREYVAWLGKDRYKFESGVRLTS